MKIKFTSETERQLTVFALNQNLWIFHVVCTLLKSADTSHGKRLHDSE